MMTFCTFAFVASLAVSQPVVAQTHETAPAEMVQNTIASEPLFADLVDRARGLKAVVDSWISSGEAANALLQHLPAFTSLKSEADELSRRDMQGHLTLKERGTDGDLTCILRGISEDLPKKVEAIERADDEASRKVALEELAYLLNDNVEVILAPPVAL